MSNFGISVYTESGFDNTVLPNNAVVDFIRNVPSSSGSKSYPLEPGETLGFSEMVSDVLPDNTGIMGYTDLRISGNQLIWTSTGSGKRWVSIVVVYKTKVQV